ncbi:hypothetical protein AVEN_78743-1 [Araneus ventricosus]|uniref:Uncharacterized protein n=1 Tax=Araneus ventricosus TaxID=182803 RepID=A0A4Y2VM23_ARAVE|nr:hypothetical protein AVEN_78743-1 [Araneus ventricosus]
MSGCKDITSGILQQRNGSTKFKVPLYKIGMGKIRRKGACQKFNLTTNIRAQLLNDNESGQYAATLFEIGKGRFKTDSNGMITLNGEFHKTVHSAEKLISKIYSELQDNMGYRDEMMMCERTVLATTNEIGRQINENNMSPIEAGVTGHLSIDTLVFNEQITSSPVTSLNSLGLSEYLLTS